MSVTDETLAILVQVTENEEVRANLDIHLYDLQILDSMRTVELIVAIGDAFGIEISPAEFERERWATPRKIIADIESRLSVGT